MNRESDPIDADQIEMDPSKLASPEQREVILEKARAWEAKVTRKPDLRAVLRELAEAAGWVTTPIPETGLAPEETIDLVRSIGELRRLNAAIDAAKTALEGA